MKAPLPDRRHPNCKEPLCHACLEDHTALKYYFTEALNIPGQDWLGRYRMWLDENNIHAEANGWGSCEAFDPKNIEAFIADVKKGREK